MKKSPSKKIWLVGLSLLILAGIVWWGWHYHQRNRLWSTYTSKQYGFEFDYLKGWGQPKVSKLTAADQVNKPGGPITEVNGAFYDVFFPKIPAANLSAKMDSADYSTKTCLTPDQCVTGKAVTKADIESVLSRQGAQANVGILRRDKDFYSSLDYYSGPRGILTVDRIVDLPKINVTAVSIVFENYATPDTSDNCTNNALATAPSSKCITQTEYNNVYRFAKSFDKPHKTILGIRLPF